MTAENERENDQEMLRCVACRRGRLAREEGGFRCVECGHWFADREGLPTIVVAEDVPVLDMLDEVYRRSSSGKRLCGYDPAYVQ